MLYAANDNEDVPDFGLCYFDLSDGRRVYVDTSEPGYAYRKVGDNILRRKVNRLEWMQRYDELKGWVDRF